MKTTITLADSGTIFINDHPELRYVHAMQPAVRVLSETECICVYKHGTALESVDSVLAQMRTLDGGQTWRNEGFVPGALPGDGPVYSYFSPHLTRLRDGRLLILSVRFRRDDPNRRCYNPETGGCLFPDTTFFVTSDKGKTWSGPQVIPIGGRYAYSGGPIVELNDGRWMVVFETWKPYDDPSPLKTRVFALFSSDQGQHWGDETVVYQDEAGRKAFWDVQYRQLRDGTFLGMAWSHDPKAAKDLPHHRIVSTDNGRTWSLSEPTNRHGQFNVTLELPDGRLLGVYNLRNAERPGVYAALSEDQGQTWDLDNQVQVWDALGQANIGLSRGMTFLESLATFAFGKPDVDLINDHEVITAFWATLSCITHIRWCKITIE